jgi:hypothetical protein
MSMASKQLCTVLPNKQSLQVAAPALDHLPTPQAVQPVLLVAPLKEAYVPALQFTQAADELVPLMEAHVPATQLRHDADEVPGYTDDQEPKQTLLRHKRCLAGRKFELY